jgi:hypothetical protein
MSCTLGVPMEVICFDLDDLKEKSKFNKAQVKKLPFSINEGGSTMWNKENLSICPLISGYL